MDRNYCFRHKRHSYAACDAALVASIYYNISINHLYYKYIAYLLWQQSNSLRFPSSSKHLQFEINNDKLFSPPKYCEL